MKFTDLRLSEALLKAVCERGHTHPTEIQSQAIPLLLESDNDFVGQAQTGTGKTAAFLLPLINRLMAAPEGSGPSALILTPTRELAQQVDEELKSIARHTRLSSVVIFGGASYDKQISELKRKRPQIIVGTPGRVIDLMERKVLSFRCADYFVLDEADEMLKMGFFDDVQMILKTFQPRRKMWMFSATMPAPILNMIQNECREPSVVKVKKKTLSNADVEQRYYLVERRKRAEALYRLIQVEKDIYGIVFCRTRVETKELASFLMERGLKVESLSGELSQAQREFTMARFRSKKVPLLICTDVAARGIDINDLTHVFNYGLPQDIDSYVHRIGRTGRAGSKGIAASLVDPRDKGFLRRIEDVTKSPMNHCQLPTVDQMKANLIASEIEKMEGILTSVQEKGEAFKLDAAYEVFAQFFQDLTKEELQKVIFTYMFNRDLMRLNDMGDLQVAPQRRERSARRMRSNSGGGRDGDRDRSRNRNRNGNRRSDSRKSAGSGRRQKRKENFV